MIRSRVASERAPLPESAFETVDGETAASLASSSCFKKSLSSSCKARAFLSHAKSIADRMQQGKANKCERFPGLSPAAPNLFHFQPLSVLCRKEKTPVLFSVSEGVLGKESAFLSCLRGSRGSLNCASVRPRHNAPGKGGKSKSRGYSDPCPAQSAPATPSPRYSQRPSEQKASHSRWT